MKVLKLTIDEVEKYKDIIASMLGQSFKQSFPETTFELTTFYDRVESLKEYIIEEKASIYGSILEGNLAGFIWFFEKNTPSGKMLHINHFVVDESFRGRGVGGKLWDSVETYAIKKEIKDIELFVTKDNGDAVDFYLKRDFEVERLVMKKRL